MFSHEGWPLVIAASLLLSAGRNQQEKRCKIPAKGYPRIFEDQNRNA